MAEQIYVNEDELKEVKEGTEKEINIDEQDLKGYEDKYSEDGLWKKIKKYASKIGIELVYKALQLYYVAQSPTCPPQVKAGIYGALGYLIMPLDFIPDIAPGIGYTDDAAAIAIALALAQAYINDDIKKQAKDKIASFLGKEWADKI